MNKDPIDNFFQDRNADIESMGADEELRRKSLDWMLHADKYTLITETIDGY